MELPTQAVNTLSDTAWGAIWVITVACMGTVITTLSLYVRSLNRTILEITDKRTNDAKEMYEASLKLTRESLTTVDKACKSINDLGAKMQNVENAISRFRTGGS